MTRRIAILAPGQMGAGIGATLVAHGLEVLVPLEGRSAASRARAEAAGMRPAGDDEVVACDFVFSVVPPAFAIDAAKRCADACARTGHKPVFVEMNAISPATTLGIEPMFSALDVPFVDGGIIGPPPGGKPGPTICLSGPAASSLAVLDGCGLTFRVLDAPVGSASALKMCYAGITKGVTAVVTTMLAAAGRAEVREALIDELALRQGSLLAALRRNIPAMLPKARRWAPEMREIATFIGSDRPEHAIYEGAAGLYQRIGDPQRPMADEIDALLETLAALQTSKSPRPAFDA